MNAKKYFPAEADWRGALWSAATFNAGATCRSGRAAQSGSPDNQDAPCIQLLHDALFLRAAPLNAVLLGRQVVQARKAATSRRTPYSHAMLQGNHPQNF